MIDAPTPGLYLHVPFCSGKCHYCDFYSLNAPQLIPLWLDGLRREIGLAVPEYDGFDTLYIGGGTPSHLNRDQLAELFDAVAGQVALASEAEVTLEANPEDMNPPHAQFIRDAGVNRISLGVQSFNDDELMFLGRRHNADQAVQAVEAFREAGTVNLGLDLIYGLPGQTIAGWLNTLKRALEFTPEHLSCYQLTVEQGTRFGRLFADGRLSLPDDEASRDFFLTTSRFLTESGYLHYEVSNFSRGSEHRARHNRKYWVHAPYLGIGPSAHSFRAGRRWWNHSSVRHYHHDLEAGRRPIAGEETLSEDQLVLEAISLGLRTSDGIPLKLALAQPGGADVVGGWIDAGLADIQDNRLILRPEGLIVAEALALRLSG